MDHYSALGVSRTADLAAIRAAYLALMRRYHPDANPSPSAADRARTITAAYSVLSNERERAAYDRRWQFEYVQHLPGPRPKRALTGPISFAMTLVVLSLIVVGVWMQQPARQYPAGIVSGSEISAVARERLLCGAPALGAPLKAELVRQAANVQASDRAAFISRAVRADVWVGSPYATTAKALGQINCSAAMVIQLPPGLTFRGGRQTLIGDIDYSITVDGSDRSPTIKFAAPPQITTALASLMNSPIPPDDIELAAASDPALDILSQAPPIADISYAAGQPVAPRPAPVRAPRSSPAGEGVVPTPDCRSAEERWSLLTCGSRSLSMLTRQLAIFDKQSWTHATSQERALLRQSRSKFFADRTSCQTESCLRQVLLARMKDVAEITGTGEVAVDRKISK